MTSKHLFWILAWLACLSPGKSVAQATAEPEKTAYVPQTFLLKVLPPHDSPPGAVLSSVAFNQLAAQYAVTTVRQLFPHHRPPAVARTSAPASGPAVDLRLLYEIAYDAPIVPSAVAAAFAALPGVAYAEPRFCYEVLHVPLDPQNNLQTYLSVIRAFDAWEVSKGSTEVVMAIVDSGVDWDHPDMVDNVHLNLTDPIDGVDNDNDGYVDNYRGWDFAGTTFLAHSPDNDPMVMGSNNRHGSHVAGIAGATTDNNVGISGVGYRCRVLPVKVAADDDTRGGGGVGLITHGFDGIIYAADMGAAVINCSWGGTTRSKFGQDAVQYATFNRDALVVAAAGNSNNTNLFFPASYAEVLSVAATQNNDLKAGFSSYNTAVDVCAPGVGIYSTFWNDAYGYEQGTSMAAPIAAAAAALVKSVFPSYSGLQLKEQLRTTADRIDSLNPAFAGQLGAGRINLYRALTAATPSVRTVSLTVTDQKNDLLQSGDTLRIWGVYQNFLQPTQPELQATLRSASPYVQILDSVTLLGSLATLQLVSQEGQPFVVRVLPDAPDDTEVAFEIVYQQPGYRARESFRITLNAPYVNIRQNQIASTITSAGRIGYQQPHTGPGLGWKFDQNQLLGEMGLMLATAPDRVASTVRGQVPGTLSDNFAPVLNVGEDIFPGADYALRSVFKVHPSQQAAVLPLEVQQQTLAWRSPPHDQYLLVQYTLRHQGDTALTTLYAGLFADWEVSANGLRDRAFWNGSFRLGYVTDAEQQKFVGIQLLTETAPPNCYSLALDGSEGGITLNDGFSDVEKFAALASGTLVPTAGQGGIGKNVAQVVGIGPLSLLPGDSVRVGFALHAATTLEELMGSAAAAATHYNQVVTRLPGPTNTSASPVPLVFPNPVGQNGQLSFATPWQNAVGVRLYDGLGRLRHQWPAPLGERLQLPMVPPGIYWLEVQRPGGAHHGQRVIIR